eukprot:4187457-Pyramimonas_sp.AAC.1
MQMARLMPLASQAQSDQIDGRGRAYPELDIFDFLQARASLANGKGAGADGVPMETFKALPWKAALHIYDLFRRRLRFEPVGESPFWRILQFLGIPKVHDVRTFKDLRWICKSATLQKWFVRSLRPQLRRQMRPSH